jgi:hypothetical protein
MKYSLRSFLFSFKNKRKKRSSSIFFFLFSRYFFFFVISTSFYKFISVRKNRDRHTYQNLCIFRYIHKCFHFYNTTLTTFLFYTAKSIRFINFNLVSKCIIIDLYKEEGENFLLDQSKMPNWKMNCLKSEDEIISSAPPIGKH